LNPQSQKELRINSFLPNSKNFGGQKNLRKKFFFGNNGKKFLKRKGALKIEEELVGPK